MKIDWYKIEEWAMCIVISLVVIFMLLYIIALETIGEKNNKEMQIFFQECHVMEGVVIEETGDNKLACIPTIRLK